MAFFWSVPGPKDSVSLAVSFSGWTNTLALLRNSLSWAAAVRSPRPMTASAATTAHGSIQRWRNMDSSSKFGDSLRQLKHPGIDLRIESELAVGLGDAHVHRRVLPSLTSR